MMSMFFRKLLGLFMFGVAFTAVTMPAKADQLCDFQAFQTRYRQHATTPEGALKLYFDAVFCYLPESTRPEASKMLRHAMHSDLPIERSPVYATFVQRLRDPASHHIFRSFAQGASPDNGYSMSLQDFKLTVLDQRQEADYTKVFLQSMGADNPRPVWVKQFDDGLWYTINNASTYVQVRPPRMQATDAGAGVHGVGKSASRP